MPPLHTQMLDWLLGELQSSGEQGITISNLFQNLDEFGSALPSLQLDDNAKNQLWKALSQHGDVTFKDRKSTPALKSKDLRQLLDERYGSRRIALRAMQYTSSQKRKRETAKEAEEQAADSRSPAKKVRKVDRPKKDSAQQPNSDSRHVASKKEQSRGRTTPQLNALQHPSPEAHRAGPRSSLDIGEDVGSLKGGPPVQLSDNERRQSKQSDNPSDLDTSSTRQDHILRDEDPNYKSSEKQHVVNPDNPESDASIASHAPVERPPTGNSELEGTAIQSDINAHNRELIMTMDLGSRDARNRLSANADSLGELENNCDENSAPESSQCQQNPDVVNSVTAPLLVPLVAAQEEISTTLANDISRQYRGSSPREQLPSNSSSLQPSETNETPEFVMASSQPRFVSDANSMIPIASSDAGVSSPVTPTSPDPSSQILEELAQQQHQSDEMVKRKRIPSQKMIADNNFTDLQSQNPAIYTPRKRGRPPGRKVGSNIHESIIDPDSSNTERQHGSEAIFTSQMDVEREEEDLLRKAGVPGVYLNPLGINRFADRKGKGRRPKYILALFKSSKLRDPHWLDNNQGSWIPGYEKAVSDQQTLRQEFSTGSGMKRIAFQGDKSEVASLHRVEIASEDVDLNEVPIVSEKPVYSTDSNPLATKPKPIFSNDLAKISYLLPQQAAPATGTYVSPYQYVDAPGSGLQIHPPGSRNLVSGDSEQNTPFDQNAKSAIDPSLRQRQGSAPPNTIEQNSAPPSTVPMSQEDRKKADDEKQAILLCAEKIDVGSSQARMEAIYYGAGGTLALSRDSKTLTFLSLDELVPTNSPQPRFSIRLSSLIDDPIISMPGSNPMELRFKTKDGDEDAILYCFDIGLLAKGRNAANVLRAKVVTARHLVRLRASKDPAGRGQIVDASQAVEVMKPHLCETCGKRWKNREGIKYHRSSAQTTCNPNYVPPETTEASHKRKRTYKRKKSDKVSSERRPKTVQHNAENGIESDANSDSSEDSIFEWAEQVATSTKRGFAKIATTPRSKPQASQSKETISQSLTLEESIQQAQKDILKIIKSNDGIFPGEGGLWFAFVEYTKRHLSASGFMPTWEHYQEALGGLVSKEELRIMKFSFDDLGSEVTRSIAVLPAINDDSIVVRALKESIKAKHPEFYVPPEFAAINRTLPESQISSFSDQDETDSDYEEQSGISEDIQEEMEDDEEDDDNDESPLKRRRLQSERESEDDLPLFDHENANDTESSKKSHFDPLTGLSMAKPAVYKRKKQAAKRAKLNAERQRLGLSPLPAERRIPIKAFQLKPLSHPRRARSSAPSRATRMPDPITYLQNADGAWSTRLSSEIGTQKRVRRVELPEPVTYIQDMEGAWSIRPFGHGVKPIHARPIKRADGNPHLNGYLKKIEGGFRPVLMPMGNRQFLPAVPSKHLLAGQSTQRSKQMPKVFKVRANSASAGDNSQPSDNELESILSETADTPINHSRQRSESRRPTTYKDQGRGKVVFDEIHELNYFAPQKSKPGRWKANPGLYTLPPGFGLGFQRDLGPGLLSRSHALHPGSQAVKNAICVLERIRSGAAVDDSGQSVVFDFWTDIEETAEWEQGSAQVSLLGGDIEPGTGWINHNLKSLDSKYDHEFLAVRWSDDAQFDMETLPYDDLEESKLVDTPTAVEVRTRRQPQSNIKPASLSARTRRDRQAGKTIRYLTSDTKQFAGMGEAPEKIAEALGYQALDLQIPKTRMRLDAVTDKELCRLVVAVVMFRALLGGLDQAVDWVLIASIFKVFTVSHLQKRYKSVYDGKAAQIEQLVLDFQEAFLPAYEDGRIPPIDYENLVDYDWLWLIEWTIKNVNTSLTRQDVLLPGSREQLDDIYQYQPRDFEATGWREAHFAINAGIFKRIDKVASVASILPAISSPTASFQIEEMDVIKSWARATALTPDADRDAHTEEKLLSLDPKVVEDAFVSLKDAKVFMDKKKKNGKLVHVPGFKYKTTEAFHITLSRKQITEQQYLEAIEFKRSLDKNFVDGSVCVRHSYFATEGALMCLTSLQAYGHVRLQPVGVPDNRFGMIEVGYETRSIPSSKYIFDIEIYATEKYVFDSDNPIASQALSIEAPRGSTKGEVPVWYGITGKLMPELWKKILAAFAGVIALRSGCSVDHLMRSFKPTLEQWEIRLLLRWGVEVGIFHQIEEGLDGWVVSEWWWLFVGTMCAG